MGYECECIFCEETIEMGRSEYPYTDSGCGWCGARFQFSNYDEEIYAVKELPRTSYVTIISAEIETPKGGNIQSPEDAKGHVIERVLSDPENNLEVTSGPEGCVTKDRVSEVLDECMNGDLDVGVAKKLDISEYEIEA